MLSSSTTPGTNATATQYNNLVSDVTGLYNQYSFLVTESVDTANLTDSTLTLINFDTETYDIGSGWNTGTKKFVAPVAGYYTFCAQAYFYGGVTDGNYAEIVIRKNGTTVLQRGRARVSGSNEVTPNVTTRVHLDAGDYIEFMGIHTMGVNTVDVFANSEYTFAWGRLDLID